MVTVKIYTSIYCIEPWHWDSILTREEIFHSHHFISIVEDSKVENAELIYLLFYENDTLVATTVLSAFSISLDLFISASWLVNQLKKYFPRLFTVRILVCGLPASFGQSNLKVVDTKYIDEVSSLLAQEMFSQARKLKISFLAIKEFTEREVNNFQFLRQRGFFLANSIPYMQMNVSWRSFEEYIASMRHPYRRKIRLSLKKIGRVSPVIISNDSYNAEINSPALVLTMPDKSFAGDFYQLYLKVMERTATKLETLNQAFFENLFLQQEDYRILKLVVKGKIISAAVLVFSGDTLTFMLVGRENEKDEYDSYFNLVYGMIALAILEGFKIIKLGQTAYWVKQCVGGEPENEYIWFSSSSKFWHWILRKGKKIVFPETKLKKVNAFKRTAEKTRDSKDEKLIIEKV